MELKKYIPFVLLVGIIIFLIPYSIPLVLALLTSVLLEPFVKLLNRTFSIKRIWSVVISFTLFLALMLIGCYWAVTSLVVQVIEFSEQLPEYAQYIFENVEAFVIQLEEYYQEVPPEYLSTIQDALEDLRKLSIDFLSGIANGIVGFATGVPLLLIQLLIYLVSLFLFSLDLPRLHKGFLNLFSENAKEKVQLVLKQLSFAFVGFLRAQLILSFLTFLIAWIGLLILDVKYALIFSLLIVIVDILPILGTGSFLVPWALYNLYAGDQRLAIGLLVLFFLITIFRRIIEPKILGSSLGISALAALASLYIGFALLGVVGLIIGPAIVIIIKSLVNAGFLNVKIDF
ncbi:sporulation integral membrane protein YtvI [Pseudalkalibacillus berkeleyi]|uniref:Sporulation integral membrane protein YtvI n=1 Tax=Pseudalkalibacillus berkeleyi TaxID=1069813 RepID=A0ABS9GY03_9BACL|nr:sporulation integral membrane protein YtvI [Pseudalkalibacillus berkeleyi]MCF6136373.1 sporulation integral membrane protein YtvI [Pseudalkalibacillus berkeleyi]